MPGTKSANSELFKDFWDEAEMEKNKSNGDIYFVIVTNSHQPVVTTSILRYFDVAKGTFPKVKTNIVPQN